MGVEPRRRSNGIATETGIETLHAVLLSDASSPLKEIRKIDTAVLLQPGNY